MSTGDDEEDPYNVEYIVRGDNPEDDKKKEELDADSPVRGTFRKIEEAGASSREIHANHTVMYAGLICPIVCEEEFRVKIMHGHTPIWISKDDAGIALSARKKERKERWMSIFSNPSPLPSKK